MPPSAPYTPDPSWVGKFRNAFRGVPLGMHGQRSFLVHIPFAVCVIAAAAGLRVNLIEWCILLLCVTVVLAAEMFNSALEYMAKAITDQEHYHLGTALDIGSASVLIASMGATLVGLLVFGNRLLQLLG